MTGDPEPKQPESMSLARLTKARALLASARGLEDLREIRAEAAAMTSYFAARKESTEAHAHAWEILQLANRELGRLCAALPKHQSGGGRPTSKPVTPGLQVASKATALAGMGVSRMQASRWERLAQLPESEWSKRLSDGADRIRAGNPQKPIDATSSGAEHDGDAWGTPEPYIIAAREVLGGIELDPASNAAAQNVVRAERFYTREDSGLEHDWTARSVWLNPPFSTGLIERFVGRFMESFEERGSGAGLLLVNSATETGWFQSALRLPVCFPSRRIAFINPLTGVPVQGNRQGQALFYAGPDLEKFCTVFEKFGRIMVPR